MHTLTNIYHHCQKFQTVKMWAIVSSLLQPLYMTLLLSLWVSNSENLSCWTVNLWSTLSDDVVTFLRFWRCLKRSLLMLAYLLIETMTLVTARKTLMLWHCSDTTSDAVTSPTSSIDVEDVFNDIDNMFQGLAQELDEMLTLQDQSWCQQLDSVTPYRGSDSGAIVILIHSIVNIGVILWVRGPWYHTSLWKFGVSKNSTSVI